MSSGDERSFTDSAGAAPLPRVRIGWLEVTRFIIGGNPFSGFSHQSAEVSQAMVNYYTTERIKATLRHAERLGVNTCIMRGDRHIIRVLNEYFNEGGGLQWLAQTCPELRDVAGNIRQIKAAGAQGCYLHGGMVDGMTREGRAEELRPWVELIKELGLLCGIASHNPKFPLVFEEIGLEPDFYLCCFYDIYSRGGEIYVPEDREAMCATIRALPRPVIAYKIMAAGRNDPDEAFKYAFANIKPTDAVAVGIYTENDPDQLEEDVALTIRYGSG